VFLLQVVILEIAIILVEIIKPLNGIRLEWISSAEATKLVKITKDMVEKLKHLPPANFKSEGIPQEDKK